MTQYYKTDLGIESLKQRSLNLNARQRRLLLLIGTDDFDLLAEQFKRRIAPPELLEQLLEMGLISRPAPQQIQATLAPKNLNTEIETGLPHQGTQLKDHSAEEIFVPSISQSSITDFSAQQPSHENEMQLSAEILDFEQVKLLMVQLLQQHCGLMAKQLITRILQTTDLRSLKLCQMQWITTLQESRIAPQELNRCLNQINFSLQKLMS
ncbi:hypothetical protein B9T26_11710 [Acinetobacter sp. ANC 4169]|uniref:hypothetical protein n=1 Tax=Acinetobacter sp. ANC 4169 TaxID=1977879 RepID=UPI000A355AC4|nr:hypothetical protein [Acinetobacter sp. ANC 4169]OTG71578.1 hypothetical protein B9T26_11710 [Acinetobacter sp. ANC 4169]